MKLKEVRAKIQENRATLGQIKRNNNGKEILNEE